MSQYFFNVRKEAALFEDKRGGEFSNLRAAWDWAVQDARSMIAEGVVEGPIDQHWVEICDTAGKLVATVPFRRAMPGN